MVRFGKNDLERAMRRASRDPEAAQDDFFAALLEATLFVPEPRLRPGPGGDPVHTLFSSRAALERAFPGEPFREIAATAVFADIAEAPEPVVLDLGGDPFYLFAADEVRALAQGLLPGQARLRPHRLPAGHRFALGLPAENPLALKAALRPALEAQEAVQAAYLLQIADRERPRLFLGLLLDEADDDAMAEIMQALDPVLQEHLGRDQLLDAAMLNGTELLEACRSVGPPFYARTRH
jgi:hypothetical protein